AQGRTADAAPGIGRAEIRRAEQARWALYPRRRKIDPPAGRHTAGMGTARLAGAELFSTTVPAQLAAFADAGSRSLNQYAMKKALTMTVSALWFNASVKLAQSCGHGSR